MKLKHIHAILLSGTTWLLIGFFLLFKGLHYTLFAAVFQVDSAPLLRLFSAPEKGALSLIALGIAIGFAKGRFVLSKTVHRVVTRILSHPEPIPLKKVYTKGYLLLIGLMMGIGMGLRFSPVPFDVRGVIDVAVGSALVIGALLYFQKGVYLSRRGVKTQVAPEE